MKTHSGVLLLAATLLVVPALVSAHGERGHMREGDDRARAGFGHMMDDDDHGHMGYGHMTGAYGHEYMEPGHHDWGRQGRGYLNAERFEQHLNERLAEFDSAGLREQFIATQQARLTMQEQQMKLHRLLAEARARELGDAELRAATLDKIAADDKFRQQQLRLMRETLNKLGN